MLPYPYSEIWKPPMPSTNTEEANVYVSNTDSWIVMEQLLVKHAMKKNDLTGKGGHIELVQHFPGTNLLVPLPRDMINMQK